MGRFWQILVLSLLLGIGALWLVFPDSFSMASLQQLGHSNPWYWLLLLSMLIVRWLLGGLRMKLFGHISGVKLGLWRAVRTDLMGMFASVISPAGGGNALGIVWFLRRYNVAFNSAVMMAALLIMLDMSFFAWSAPLSFIYLLQSGIIPSNPYLSVAVVVLSLCVVLLSQLLIFRLRYALWLLRQPFKLPLLRRFSDNVGQLFSQLDALGRGFAAQPWYVFVGLHALTTAIWLLHLGLFWVTAQMLAVGVARLELITSHIVIHSLAFIIPTPGASGYTEGALSLATGQAVSQTAALSILLYRLLSYYIFFIIGPLIGGAALANAKANDTEQLKQAMKQHSATNYSEPPSSKNNNVRAEHNVRTEHYASEH